MHAFEVLPQTQHAHEFSIEEFVFFSPIRIERDDFDPFWMARVSNLQNNTIASCKQVNSQSRQTLFCVEYIMRAFEANTCQNLLQNFQVGKQTSETESVTD